MLLRVWILPVGLQWLADGLHNASRMHWRGPRSLKRWLHPARSQSAIRLTSSEVDHTRADIFLVSELDGQVIGRPWLSLALDVASRCVRRFYVGMERPGTATVGLLPARVVLPKASWLAKIAVVADWPMRGIPRVLHLQRRRTQEQGAP